MSEFAETASSAVEKPTEGVTNNSEGVNQRDGVSDKNTDGIPQQNDIPDAPKVSESDDTPTTNGDQNISETEENTENKNDGLTDEEKQKIKEETGWSDEIIDHISSMEQYEIYKNAGLKEEIINGKPCLVKSNIDWDYVDPKTGKTNRELAAEGRSPVDSKTGEKIELHHMGQDPNGPFVELTENSEHGDGNHGTLHPDNGESWRHEPGAKAQYNQERAEHWKSRAAGGN